MAAKKKKVGGCKNCKGEAVVIRYADQEAARFYCGGCGGKLTLEAAEKIQAAVTQAKLRRFIKPKLWPAPRVVLCRGSVIRFEAWLREWAVQHASGLLLADLLGGQRGKQRAVQGARQALLLAVQATWSQQRVKRGDDPDAILLTAGRDDKSFVRLHKTVSVVVGGGWGRITDATVANLLGWRDRSAVAQFRRKQRGRERKEKSDANGRGDQGEA